MKLKEVTDYLDDYLDIHAFRDDAANGLQVENNTGNVKKIGLAVDGCFDAIVKAGEAKVQSSDWCITAFSGASRSLC